MSAFAHPDARETERIDVSLAGFIYGLVIGVGIGVALAIFFA